MNLDFLQELATQLDFVEKSSEPMDSQETLIAVIDENCGKLAGFEKEVWQKSLPAHTDRLIIELEMPGYAMMRELQLNLCDAVKISATEQTQLPVRITVELGPSLSELVPYGDMLCHGPPVVNAVKKNGFKTGSVQVYAITFSDSIGPARYLRINFVYAHVSSGKTAPVMMLARLSAKVRAFLLGNRIIG